MNFYFFVNYPTRATRPVTRPVLNRPNYPYYPWPAGIWTIFDPTRPDPWKPMKIITRWPVTIFNLDPLDPWKKLLLTRITRDIFSRNIFTKSLTFWSEIPIFSQIYVGFAKKFAQNFNFCEKLLTVWPVNFLLLTRLTRNIFPFDPPTRWKIVGWPDPALGKEPILS